MLATDYKIFAALFGCSRAGLPQPRRWRDWKYRARV